MKSISKKLVSLLLVVLMLASTMPAFAESTKKWTETDMPEGWTKVENEGGVTLGYTKGTNVSIIEVDGYAFKDLNRNGALDVYEDWRVDYEERARALAYSGELTTKWMMGLKMNAFGFGAASPDALADSSKTALDLGWRSVGYPGGPAATVVGWNNTIQKYIENLDEPVCIPATFGSDPLHGNGVTAWPGYLGLAATFDPELAATYGKVMSKEWRALGITKKCCPQIDLATEPRWKRADDTFGEDPQLSMDMAVAMVNAIQSTYDENGNDIGWGKDSVNCMIKHLTGDGAAEGGREAHSLDGAYNVFPGGQFFTQYLPFAACLNLPGKTGVVSAAMTNFSIAVDEFGESVGGERVATSFSEWKINELWRGLNNWDGYILTDYNVHVDKCFGMEDATQPERLLQVLIAGNDAFGNLGAGLWADVDKAMEAYAIGVERLGQEAMDTIMKESTRRILKTMFNVNKIDNPYLDLETASTVPKNAENAALAFDAMTKSIVMVKNSNNLIKPATEEKLTVYIPWKFIPATKSFRGTTPASVAPVFNLQEAMKYFNVVSDKQGTPSGKDADGKPALTADDIIRASAEEIAKCDIALVRIKSPQNANPTTTYDENMQVPADYEYLPISLQYRPYTADSLYVRMESIGGQITSREVQGIYGPETIYEKENRSYYGKTGLISNESDLDLVLYAASVCDKVVVCADVKNAMIFSEFEGEVDSILLAWSGDRVNPLPDAPFFELVSGKVEPSGLLPMQMPADMETVEEQFEDVPRDMRCHVDADGNTYDFTFGMNWSGKIEDERVAKYNVPPIVGEDPFLK